MKKLSVLMLGVALSLLLLVASELVFYVLLNYFPPTLRPIPENFSSAVLHRPVHSLPVDFSRLLAINGKTFNYDELPMRAPPINEFEGQFSYVERGITKAKPGVYKVRGISGVRKKEIFRVKYTLGNLGFRVTPQSGKRGAYLLLVGDSFTFGVGVNDSETMPSALARSQNLFRVYNFSFPGHALNDHLLIAEKENLENMVTESEGFILYIFNEDHFTRLLGSYRYLASWGASRPAFTPESNGTPQYVGSFEQFRPLELFFAKLLYKSSMGRYLNRDWYLLDKVDGAKFFADSVLELKRRYLRRFPKGRFVFVVPPTTVRYLDEILPLVDERGIESLVYSALELQYYLKGPRYIDGDGHHTPEANRIWGEQLARDLLKIPPPKE